MLKHLFSPTNIFIKLYQSPDRSICVKKWFYNILVKQLDELYVGLPLSNFAKSYQGFDNVTVFHITNEYLAHSMYMAIKEKRVDDVKFCNMKFVVIDKQEKVAFVVCDIVKCYRSNFIELVSIADSFSALLSYEGSKIYVSYKKLFSEANTITSPLLMECLLSSISLDPVSLSSEDIEEIINLILKQFLNNYSLWELIAGIKSEANDFFSWLKKGIIYNIKEHVNVHDASIRVNNITPLALYVNIFKYALNRAAFSSLHELFVLDKRFDEFDIAKEIIVFDQELFAKSLTLKEENNEFVIFTDDNNNVFAKLKNSDKGSELMDKVSSLMSKNLVLNSRIVRCLNGDVYLFISKANSYNTLTDYICRQGITDEKFITFITNLYYFISSETSYRNLNFQPNTNFLNCMCYSEGKPDVSFLELSNIAIDTKGEPFDYTLVIMMAIKKYVYFKQIPSYRISTCEFSKVFHPSFIVQVKNYIENGSYSRNDTGLNHTILSGCHNYEVEFVEKLPTNDPYLLSRLSFFEDVNLPEDLKVALRKVKEFDVCNGYLDLDISYLGDVTSRSINHISDYITTLEGNNRKYFLIPEKVIISQHPGSDGNYEIIGVLWNRSQLCNAVEVIKSKKLNCKQIYQFISYLFTAYSTIQLNVNIPNRHKYLLLDMSTMEFVLTKGSLSFPLYTPRHKYNLEEYYKSLINFLIADADFESYDLFAYEEITSSKGASRFKHLALQSQVDNMRLCKEHNRWYLAGGLCCECEKIYGITKVGILKTPIYKDSVSEIFPLKGYYTTLYRLSNVPLDKYIRQVKIGIENKLFDGFFRIFPECILLSSDDHSVLGINYATQCLLDEVVTLDSFKHIQKLKAILLIYKHLLPRILNGSFICTDKRIFETIVMHKDHKGEISVPNLVLLECNVIVSNDEALKKERIFKTKKAFSKFLIEYIMSDEYLASMINSGEQEFITILKDIELLLFSDSTIKHCLNLYKNYCKTHMIPYSSKSKLCPVCKKDGIVQAKAVFETQEFFEQYEDDASDYDGGEANIHVVPTEPMEALKLFKNTVDLSFKSRILAKALKKSSLIQGFNAEHSDIQIISVNKIYYMLDQGVLQLKGFTQDFIEGSFKISNLKDKNFVKEHGYSTIDIVEILIKVCKGITFIHSIGGFIGDLNGGNILIKDKCVYIIDIDGMSFDDVKNCVYTNLYIYPPSAENNNITKEDDWYSLAVQAFYYLTYSHPFRGICDDDTVPYNETERMTLGLSVLGNHGIVPPSISIGWDFLPSTLLNYFLDTFEGDKRENMLDVLQSYYRTLSKTQAGFTELSRSRDVFRNICENVYLDSDNNLMFKEKELANVKDANYYRLIDNNLLIGFDSMTYLLNLSTGAFYALSQTYDSNLPLYILDENIYYTSTDRKTLLVDAITDAGRDISTGEYALLTHEIKKDSLNQIISLCVAQKDKFVFVEDNVDTYSFDIYCNSILVRSISKNAFSNTVKVGIEYDELSQNWCVIFKSQNLTIGIVIQHDSGQTSQFEIAKSIHSSTCFYGNVLYFAGDGKIYYFNVLKHTLKSLECEYATKDSFVSRYSNKFVITNPGSVYMYEKP